MKEVHLRLRNDSTTFLPVNPLIRAFWPRDLHLVKGCYLTIAATRFAARWRHGNQRSISRQLQHRLWIGLAHPLELLRR